MSARKAQKVTGFACMSILKINKGPRRTLLSAHARRWEEAQHAGFHYASDDIIERMHPEIRLQIVTGHNLPRHSTSTAAWFLACNIQLRTWATSLALTTGDELQGLQVDALDVRRPGPDLCMRIFPILMPLQQALRAFSMDSPLLIMLTPHSFLAKSTPT